MFNMMYKSYEILFCSLGVYVQSTNIGNNIRNKSVHFISFKPKVAWKIVLTHLCLSFVAGSRTLGI